MLSHKNPHTRKRAAEALGELQDKRALEALIVALHDEDTEVRMVAASGLGGFKDKRAVEPLMAAVRDQDPAVRRVAAHTLGELKGKRALEALIVALHDEDTEVRMVAASGLRRFKDKRAVEPLIAALKDQDPAVRQFAEEALAKLKDDRALEPLIAAQRSEGARKARALAREAGTFLDELKSFARRHAARASAIRMEGTSVEVVRAWDKLEAAARRSFEAAIGADGPEGEEAGSAGFLWLRDHCLNSVYGWSESHDDDHGLAGILGAKQRAKQLENEKTAKLEEEDRQARLQEEALQRELEALQRELDAGHIESLFDILERGDAPQRARVMKLLGTTGDARAVGPLLEILSEAFDSRDRRTADQATSALEAIGVAGVQALTIGLRQDNATLQWAVAQLLGVIGSSDAKPALAKALDDPDEGVREAASVALGRIESASVNPT